MSKLDEETMDDVLFESVDEIESMEDYEVLDFYPTENAVKVRDKEGNTLIIRPD